MALYQAKVDLPFDDFELMCSKLCQMSSGMETYHFQPSPIVHGPNPDHDQLTPLYVIVALPNQLYSVWLFLACTRFS